MFDVTPKASPADQLGLVEPVHGLRKRIVVAVTDRANRGAGTDLGEPFVVGDRSFDRRGQPTTTLAGDENLGAPVLRNTHEAAMQRPKLAIHDGQVPVRRHDTPRMIDEIHVLRAARHQSVARNAANHHPNGLLTAVAQLSIDRAA